MKNAVIAFLLLATAALGFLAYSQRAAIEAQQRTTRELNAKLETISKSAALDLQAKCARQAQAAFDATGYNLIPGATYANHYNATLNKCFIVVWDISSDSARGGLTTNEELLDAFEGTLYGEYMLTSAKDAKDQQFMPELCWFEFDTGEHKLCHSYQEFRGIEKQFMGPGFH